MKDTLTQIQVLLDEIFAEGLTESQQEKIASMVNLLIMETKSSQQEYLIQEAVQEVQLKQPLIH